mgnify:CR=1 FL=1
MPTARLHITMVIGTVLLYLLAQLINELVFANSEFIRGINWIYLPAGIRLLCLLLFGISGAAGVLIASWLICFFYFFPDDFIRSFAGGIISTIAPCFVYMMARQFFGLNASLINLTAGRLLICTVAYAISNALLHHIWFALRGNAGNLYESFLIMFIGDLIGTLVVLYTLKGILSLRAIMMRTP